MGRPIHNPSTPINKRRPSSSLRQLSASLHNAASNLRDASTSTRDRRLSAVNSAYRHAFRAAVALHTEHGASPSPSSPSTLPSISPSAARASRAREHAHDLERLLRRSERLPRLPLPAALRGPMADLAARSAQLVQQRRQLDAAAADMRDLHERLLADMERTAQHFVDATHNATGSRASEPSSAQRPAVRRTLPAGVIRARVRAAVTDLPAAFRAAARAAREADEREAVAERQTSPTLLSLTRLMRHHERDAEAPAADRHDTPVTRDEEPQTSGEEQETEQGTADTGPAEADVATGPRASE